MTGVMSMSHTIYLLSPAAQSGGNYRTISRISDHLRHEGYDCHLTDPKALSINCHIHEAVNHKNSSIMIGIHALHTGAYMKDSCLPYILILGGTDINVLNDDPTFMDIMTKAVYRARFIVCFSQVNANRALSLWPGINPDKFRIIFQAVQTSPSSFCLQTYLENHHSNLWSPGCDRRKSLVFVFVGGIRPVKNPLFLVPTFQDWHAKDDRILYLIVGPNLDEKYTASVFEPAIKKCPGVVYIPGLPSEDVHAAISQSFALVNTSDSEGMCLAILEAMQLGVPVLTRDCAGNRAIVTDGHTGYLFHSPKTFLEKAEQLLNNHEVRSNMIRRAMKYVHCNHSLEQERLAYTNLVKQCIKETETVL